MSKKIDLTGRKIHQWLVMSEYGKDKRGNVLWFCQCRCGTRKLIKGSNLRSGHTKSCGCIQKENPNNKKYFENEKEIIEKYKQLKNMHKVGKLFGCSHAVINRILKENNIKPYKLGESRKIDLTGKRIGKLTVLKEGRKDKYGACRWECCCDCGKLCIVKTSDLRHKKLTFGREKSCGCATIKKDLTGYTFVRLKVLKQVGVNKQDARLWKCKCICGKTIIAKTGSLTSGMTRSCGCLQEDVARELGSRSGPDSPRWEGGLTEVQKLIRGSIKYHEWRKKVYLKYKYTCQNPQCAGTNYRKDVHHIEKLSKIIQVHNISSLEEALHCDKIWDINNGIVLCATCHTKLHELERKKVRKYTGTIRATV